jgi:hypothetical protein
MLPTPLTVTLPPADVGVLAVTHALQKPGYTTLLRHTIEQKMPILSRTPRKTRRPQL